LTANYKSFQDFTREALDAAKVARKNLRSKIQNIVLQLEINELELSQENKQSKYFTEFSKVLLSDLDSSGLL
jgi:cysteinyl-tRNA synthetase